MSSHNQAERDCGSRHQWTEAALSVRTTCRPTCMRITYHSELSAWCTIITSQFIGWESADPQHLLNNAFKKQASFETLALKSYDIGRQSKQWVSGSWVTACDPLFTLLPGGASLKPNSPNELGLGLMLSHHVSSYEIIHTATVHQIVWAPPPPIGRLPKTVWS